MVRIVIVAGLVVGVALLLGAHEPAVQVGSKASALHDDVSLASPAAVVSQAADNEPEREPRNVPAMLAGIGLILIAAGIWAFVRARARERRPPE